MKTLRSKLTVVFAFFAVIALAFGIGFMPKQASAAVDTSTGFYIEDGASIRTEEGESGIKWTAHISESKYAELNTEANSVVAIGIAIQPQGNTNEDLDIHYVYGSENYQIKFTDGAFEYSYAIFYDDLIADIEEIMGDLDETQEKAKLLEAYQTILEARPFVKHADGTYSYGEYFDTARSLQGVAIGNLVAGTYAEGSLEDALLKSYLPNGFNLADTDYVAESYYSNYDAWGDIAIDSAIPMSNARIYYGANDVTSAYNKDTGILALTADNKVETKITTDGSANDFITIYDQSTGNVYKQKFVGVTLAIDKAEDLSYFSFSSTDGFDAGSNGKGYTIAKGEIEFDGYYVLLNDIDASTYYHDFVNGSAFYATAARGLNAVISKLNDKGLTGTFDGRGFSISDINYNSTTGNNVGGLFGFINGGTLKNLGLIRPNIYSGIDTVTSGSAAFADSIINGATIQDCYFVFDQCLSDRNNHFISVNITADTVMSRVFIVLEGVETGGKFNANTTHAMFCGYTGMTDTYVINQYNVIDMGSYDAAATTLLLTAAEGTAPTVKRLNKAFSDAAYVDGVANTSIRTNFYTQGRPDSGSYDTSKYIITYKGETFDASNPSYEITLLDGVKRYTSLAKMKEVKDKENNDFSAWNPDVWTIVDGVPTFKSIENANYTYFADGVLITEEGVAVEAEKSFGVTVALDGADTGIKPKLEVISVDGAEDVVSVNGNKVTALAEGEQDVKVIYGSSEFVFTVNVMAAPVDLETEYNFSAYDGVFFDNNFNVVSLVDTLINFAQVDTINILGAKDSNDNTLTVSETNAILGLDLGKQTTWKETSFVVYTDAGAFRVHFNAADLIVDEAEDFAYFTLDGVLSKTSAGDISYDGDDFVWDGYHVMVKDIVSTAYVHNAAVAIDPSSISMENVAESNYGLSGVFDGQGHTIDRMFISANSQASCMGLFGYINGGTVKNLKTNNMYSGTSGSWKPTGAGSTGTAASRLFGIYLLNGGKIEDVEFHNYGAQGFNATLFLLGAQEGTTISRVIINVACKGSNTGGFAIFRNVQSTLSDVYVIANQPFTMAKQEATGSYVTNLETNANTSVRWQIGNYDAATVDDVTRSYVNYVCSGSTSYSFEKYTATNDTGTTYSKDNPCSTNVLTTGIKRYTSLDAMKANWDNFEEGDERRNDFSNWSSSIWTISANGIPSMHVMTNA